jgi:hypothetical protein
MDLEKQAYQIYGHFHSTHEVYGVLMEEVNEFFEIVRLKPGIAGKSENMIKELEDIKAVCNRAILELKNNQIKFV